MRRVYWMIAGLVVVACEGSIEPSGLVGSYSGIAYSAVTNDGIEGIEVRLDRDTLLGAEADADFSANESNDAGNWNATIELDVDEDFCETVDSASARLILRDPSGNYATTAAVVPFCVDGSPVVEVSGVGVRMLEE